MNDVTTRVTVTRAEIEEASRKAARKSGFRFHVTPDLVLRARREQEVASRRDRLRHAV